MNKNKLKFNFHAPIGCRVIIGSFGNIIWRHRSYFVDNDDNFLYNFNIDSVL